MRHVKYLLTGLVVLLVTCLFAMALIGLAVAVLWIIIHGTWIVAGTGLLAVAYLIGKDFGWGNE